MKKLIVSAPALEAITIACQRYFYSKDISLSQGITSRTWDIYSATGKIEGFHVEQRGGRYRLICIASH